MTQETTPASDPLDEWEKLANAATPGPWRTDLNVTSWSVLAPEWKRVCSGDIPDSLWRGPLEERAASVYIADMRFIAAAREAIPALIAMVRERNDRALEWEGRSIVDSNALQHAKARATAAEERVRELENVVQRLTQPGVWLYLDGRDEDGAPRVMPGGFDVGGVDLEDELEMAKPDLALQIEREAKELGFQDGEYFWTTWTFDNGQYGEFGMCEIQPSWEYSSIDLATSRALAFLGRAET
jgi:hypothetical protein